MMYTHCVRVPFFARRLIYQFCYNEKSHREYQNGKNGPKNSLYFNTGMCYNININSPPLYNKHTLICVHVLFLMLYKSEYITLILGIKTHLKKTHQTVCTHLKIRLLSSKIYRIGGILKSAYLRFLFCRLAFEIDVILFVLGRVFLR